MGVHTRAKKGDAVVSGDVLGIVQETVLVEHRILVPAGIEGKVKSIRQGDIPLRMS